MVEHLPARNRRAQVDEYYRVLAPGGHIAILDTPNRLFPLETHSIGLPLVQWLPSRLAYAYARLARPRKFGAVSYESFVADGTGWRNATLARLPALRGPGWAGRRHRGGGLRLAVLPRHRALPHPPRPAAGLRRSPRRRSGRPGARPRSACPILNLLFQKR